MEKITKKWQGIIILFLVIIGIMTCLLSTIEGNMNKQSECIHSEKFGDLEVTKIDFVFEEKYEIRKGCK